ncbi:hypothetical protein TNCV_4090201 [Trichonephila clavipes]|uniref:Uncharacterized protein n=1 Tax=Trichonephila clavipes TaxID=2585209 RepID=A0A8X6SH74_TRICX|nr:hypothetical protein TNCV_4090201 [Trichonephila clavipes]
MSVRSRLDKTAGCTSLHTHLIVIFCQTEAELATEKHAKPYRGRHSMQIMVSCNIIQDDSADVLGFEANIGKVAVSGTLSQPNTTR